MNKSINTVKKQLSIFLCLALILTLFACNRSTVDIQTLELTDLAGNPVQLSDYKGKVVFLNFWATWCPPCIQEKGWIDRAKKELNTDEMVFLMVSQEKISTIEKFKKRKKYDFEYLKINSNIKMLGIFYIPHTFIIDREGKVVHSQEGEEQWFTPANIVFLRSFLE